MYLMLSSNIYIRVIIYFNTNIINIIRYFVWPQVEQQKQKNLKRKEGRGRNAGNQKERVLIQIKSYISHVHVVVFVGGAWWW